MIRLPGSLVRNLIYPAHERLLHRPTFPMLAELEEQQWLSRQAIEKLQMEKLHLLLRTAHEHSPWHARHIEEAGLDITPNAELTLADLRALPITDKQDMKAHRDEMVWRNVPGGIFEYNTGGSSGTPLIFYYGRLRQASDAAGRMRARRWWGVKEGDPEVYLWGAPVELNKTDRIKTIRDRLFNQLVLNAFEMSPEHMDEYIEAINRFRPTCVYGYASSIALLAARAKETGRALNTPALKVVCTTGEPLYPQQRQLISEAFGAPVANEFGSRDIGFTAHESPAGQMLLLSENFILEVLDPQGHPVQPGEYGEAVITSLTSHAQPFIRYRTGDIVRASDASCKQGRGLHVIGEVKGRTTDFIVRADGTIMHALALIYILRAVPGLKEFKIIQHEVSHIEAQIVPGPQYPADGDRMIVSGIQARLGDGVSVEVKHMEHIPVERSGKHRYVVSHVPLPDALALASEQDDTYNPGSD